MTIVQTTLNPLPGSVLVRSSVFKGSLVVIFTPDPALNASAIMFSASGDLTNDGYPEVVVTGWGGGAGTNTVVNTPVYVFSTSATGTTMLDAKSLLGVNSLSGTSTPRIADLDHNGLNDFFYLAHNENPFTPAISQVFLQVTPGQFEAKTIAGPLAISHNSTEGDFNGDGFLDIAAGGIRMGTDYFGPAFFDNAFMLYLGDAKGSFTPYAMGFTAPTSQNQGAGQFGSGSAGAIGDFDNDGRSEIILVDCVANAAGPINYNDPLRGDIWLVSDIQFSGREAWGQLHALPVPYFDAKPEYASLPSFMGDQKSHEIKVVTLDIDNDGLLDILVSGLVWAPDAGGNVAGVVQVLRNKGNLQFEDITDSSLQNFFLGKSSGHELRLVDVNGDGFLDIYMPETGNDTWGPDAGTSSQTWANTLLVNTGDGHFVQAMWNEFHEMTLDEKDILAPQLFAAGNHDFKFHDYVLPDGRLGFLKFESVFTEQGFQQAVFDFRADELLYTGPNGTNPALQGAAGFSEYFYLAHYPNVAAAVAAGTYESGLDHYLKVGRGQGLLPFAANAVIQGSAGNDSIVAREGKETIVGSAGHDTIEGGAGLDTMRFDGTAASHVVARQGSSYVVTSGADSASLHGVERLEFDNGHLALDLDGSAGTVAKMLGVLFGPQSVQLPAYVGIGLSYLDGGLPALTLMQAALNLILGPGASNHAVVNLLYQNLVGVLPSQADLESISFYLDNGILTSAQLGMIAAEHDLNLTHIDFAGLQSHGLAFI